MRNVLLPQLLSYFALYELCFSFHKKYIKGMKVNVRFTFNRTPLKLMHRALEIGFEMMEEKTQLASLQLTIGTHLAPLLEEKEQDFR